MPICPKCGSEPKEGDNFCESCSTKLGAEVSPDRLEEVKTDIIKKNFFLSEMDVSQSYFSHCFYKFRRKG